MGDLIVTKQMFTGVILAGGQARRMDGQDKGLIELAGSPMIQYVLDGLLPQVGKILINANRHHEIYRHYQCPIVADDYDGFCGPLAGMASCLKIIDTPLMVTVPCDSPFVPDDYVERMYLNFLQENAEICVAHNGERLQPVFAMIKRELYESMNTFLLSGERKIDKWFRQHKITVTDFSDVPDTFININTQDELATIEKRLEQNFN